MKRTDITTIWPEATDEQIKTIMDLNGADINKAKAEADGLRQQISALSTELEGLKNKPDGSAAQLAAVQQELDALKAANVLRDLRAKVSKDTGVPAELLTAETEEACKQQAEAIKAYAKPGGYPKVPDGGEAHPSGASATRDKFADWMNENFPASSL